MSSAHTTTQCVECGELADPDYALCRDHGHENAEAIDDLQAELGLLRGAAGWLLICHDDYERNVPVRNYDEAWEGLRHAMKRSE